MAGLVLHKAGHDAGLRAMPDGAISGSIFKEPRHAPAFSRRDAPELCTIVAPEIQRAQGKPGADCTRSLVRKSRKHTS
jgi:hypothetical protein